MSIVNLPKFGLDAELVFDRFIAEDGTLDALWDVLLSKAPKWAGGIHIRKSPKIRLPIDVNASGGFSNAVRGSAAERGPTYHALVSMYGKGDERLSGSVELRGSDSAFIVVVAIDQKPFHHIGGALSLGNRLAIQVRKKKIDGVDAIIWIRDVFRELCERTDPAWGKISDCGEYWEKVMEVSPSVRAVGRDFSKYLPGLFWLNFFGKPYLNAIGTKRVATTPARVVERLKTGILVEIYEDPLLWNEEPSRILERAVRDHLGSEFFFLKGYETSKTKSPWSTI